VALVVAAVPTVSARPRRATPPSWHGTSGAGLLNTPVLVLAVRNDGALGPPQAGRVMHWKVGSSRKVRHWLCGTPNTNESKIVNAS
jgi:hypothetical protein